MSQPRKRPGKVLLLLAFAVIAAIFGAMIFQKYRASREVPSVPPAPQEVSTVRVTLFFSSADGGQLVREAREIDVCDETADCIHDLVTELVKGPVGDSLGPVLPVQTVVNDVTVEGDTATIDLGGQIREALPAGASAETVAVYSVVDSIAVNFPQIKKVKFLVDGHDAQTLKGHLDLRAPLLPDYSLEQKPENTEPKTEHK